MTSVTKGTIVAGAIGAGVAATTNVGAHYALKKSPRFMKFMEDAVEINKSVYSGSKSIFAKYAGWCNRVYENIINSVKNGKFDYKSVGKFAAVGAATYAGFYLAYRGIKALFTKND